MGQIDRLNGLVGSVAIKAPCRAATTAAITLSGEQTIDGVALVTGDAVLVKDQGSGVDNGIYVVDTGTWNRRQDFDGSNDVVEGTMVKVNAGTVGQGFWYVTTTGSPIPGTDAIAFAQASSVLAVISAYSQILLTQISQAAWITALTTGAAAAWRTALSLGNLAVLNTVGTAQINNGTANQYLRTNSAGTATEWRSATQPTTTVLTSGSGTYTVPAGCTHFIVEGWGGGGGGGGGDGTNRGTGGGGGGYFKKLYTSPAASYSYSVGAAAAAVGQGSGGTTGNGTTFDTCTANGGAAGLVSNGSAQAGVAGGTATGGDENIQGGGSTTVEAAGAGAGSVSYGGDSPRGGFGGKVNVAVAGQIPGGGASNNNSTGTGAAGARGEIRIWEFYT